MPISRIARAFMDQLGSDPSFTLPGGTKQEREGHGEGQTDSLLTARQLDILALRALGLRAREIARFLSLSEATVHTHVRNACTRLGIHGGWGAAVHRARELGLIDSLIVEYAEKIPRFTKL